MKGVRGRSILCPGTQIVLILMSMMVMINPLLAVECIDGLSLTLFNTSSNCTSIPEIDRIFGTQVMYWNNIPYLFGNIGNNLRVWHILNPSSPFPIDESGFGVGNLGDSDYDLLNFSVCDDCRYGVANYKRGTVLFDMGSGNVPDFGGHQLIEGVNQIPGAFTFMHDGQQYLIASDLANECSDGNSTLYTFGGIDHTIDVTNVGCVDNQIRPTAIVGGFYVDGYLYLGDSSQRVYLFEVQGSGATIALSYISTPMFALMSKDKSLSIDYEYMVAIEGRSTGMNIWDLSNPGSPVKVATAAGTFNRAALKYPIAFGALQGYRHSERTFDISTLSAPQPLDHEFWSADNLWNYPDYECTGIQGATFSPDGSMLYVARYSLLQIADFSACPGSEAPTAGAGLTPNLIFPGDTATVSNQSTGEFDRSAIWVTLGPDPDGQIAAGDSTLSPTAPVFLDFAAPRDIPVSDAYYGHVAVESDDHPYSGGSTPDQHEAVLIDVDRTPDISFSIVPESPVLGDLVAATVTAEGNPAHPAGGEAMVWRITRPAGLVYEDFGSPINLDLNESGRWDIELAVHYEHEVSQLGSPEIYTASVSRQLDVLSPPAPCLADWQQVDLGSAVDVAFESADTLVVFQGFLYLGTSNNVDGSSIFRSADGIAWEEVAHGGFGDTDNTAVKTMVIFDTMLYAGTKNQVDGGQVWRSSDGVSWVKMGQSGFGNVLNQEISVFEVFSGVLYAGTNQSASGGELWRTTGTFWGLENTGGIAGSDNAAVTALAGFDGNLYAAWTGSLGFILGRRTADSGWQQVNLSGFGDHDNERVSTLSVTGGDLSLGTTNQMHGAQIWQSSDGNAWQRTNHDGFDGEPVNYTATAMAEYNSSLFVGAGNSSAGASVWRYDPTTGWCWASTNGFGDQYNMSMPSSVMFLGSLYMGTQNPQGLQLWRMRALSVFVDGFESGDASRWSAVQ